MCFHGHVDFADSSGMPIDCSSEEVPRIFHVSDNRSMLSKPARRIETSS
jgi:hypothetical protein